ncbi:MULTISPECIES: acetaldehyde dehydrogenase (acetylating) [Hydrogenibacillus]|nr:acetaldehyde dehydrogenase (acetylating) [Hydrogenibacillus sp. N12]QZA32559.1 acetaldehyde dehydrogenase (acetylating) [Hydrogenibacillus sp. N12]
MSRKLRVAIIGSGNIGTDLMYKMFRSPYLEPVWMIGIDPESEGLKRARSLGLETFDAGLKQALEAGVRPDLAFDATSAKAHIRNWKLLQEHGIQVIDLTPAARGPYVSAAVNLGEHLDTPNINMITCGGQATVPITYAVGRVVPVQYAEIVATIASKSAGPGTRQNIDEFTVTTAKALEVVGKAKKGKAIIILNPAEPPIMMRNTVYSLVGDVDRETLDKIERSIHDMVAYIQTYVPGYRLNRDIVYRDGVVSVSVEVEGLGDFLPVYAGNLDIMTTAAVKVGEEIAKHRLALVEEKA